MGASQSALNIQNPSHAGPRTQVDDDFGPDRAAFAISTTVVGEEAVIELYVRSNISLSHPPVLIRQGLILQMDKDDKSPTR
jgi:hypothetical protein